MSRFIRLFSLQITFVFAVSFFQPAAAFWGSPSTSDYLVRLQALRYIEEAPIKIKAIEDAEKAAEKDRGAAKEAEKQKFVLAQAAVIKKLQDLNKAIDDQKAPQERAIASAKRAGQEELESLKEELALKEEELEDVTEKLKANLNAYTSFWPHRYKPGTEEEEVITEETVERLKESITEAKAAIEDLELELQKAAALEPPADLAQAILITQMAKEGIERELDSIAKSVALPAEQTKRYEAQREARKKAAICMVAASQCKDQGKKPLKVENYEDLSKIKTELKRCADDNFSNASKAMKSEAASKCQKLTTISSTEEIFECVKEYRAEVLKKPSFTDSYYEYDKCDGLRTVY